MDIELAKTFLEVMSSGTFIEAAQRLNVTQTTVTARIQTLEASLGNQLFIRNRAGAKLTPAGERFAGFALTLVQTWEQAKTQLNLPEGHHSSISIGAEMSLWNPMMVDWINTLTEKMPLLQIQSDVADTTGLISLLEQGQLDAIIVHEPNYFSGFVVEQLIEEKLVHVQVPSNSSPDLFIDWGSDFTRKFDAALPQKRQAALCFNLGPLALKVMLKHGGNGYFRTRVVAKFIADGTLERLPDAPEFSYPIFIVYRADKRTNVLMQALTHLKSSLSSSAHWQV